MNRLKTRLLVTAAAIAVLGTSAQAAELVQKDDAPVTRTDSLAGLRWIPPVTAVRLLKLQQQRRAAPRLSPWPLMLRYEASSPAVWLMLKWERSAPWQSC